MPLVHASLFAFEETVAGCAVDVSFAVYSVAVFRVLVLVHVYIVGLLLLNVDFIILFVGDVWLIVEEVVLRNGCVLRFLAKSLREDGEEDGYARQKYCPASRAPQRGLRMRALLQWGWSLCPCFFSGLEYSVYVQCGFNDLRVRCS